MLALALPIGGCGGGSSANDTTDAGSGDVHERAFVTSLRDLLVIEVVSGERAIASK